MGTKKFKLSDMIPNAWFYKLKDMNKTSKTHNKNKHHHNNNNHLPPPPPPPPPSSTFKTPPRPDPQCPSRKSYYVARELTIDLPNEIDSTPPRKSKSRKSTRRSSSISTCSIPSSLSPTTFRSPPSPEETDILGKDVGFFAEDALLDNNDKQSILGRYALAGDENQPEHFDIDIGVDRMSLLHNNTSIHLPPIITKQKPKPKPNAARTTSMTINSPGGVRLRMNSPRIVGRKQGQNGHKIIGRKSTSSSKKRRSISESFAVVKTSFDPQGDFRESMVEMVLQNNLTAAKDLEDLLACYLSLNSDEYHDVIINVFKQIWIDLRRRQ